MSSMTPDCRCWRCNKVKDCVWVIIGSLPTPFCKPCIPLWFHWLTPEIHAEMIAETWSNKMTDKVTHTYTGRTPLWYIVHAFAKTLCYFKGHKWIDRISITEGYTKKCYRCLKRI